MKHAGKIAYIFVFIFLVIIRNTSAEKYENQPAFIETRPINVGIIRSHPKETSFSERLVINAVLIAIEEINNHGGVIKRKVKPVIIHGTSGQSILESEIEQKINDKKISAVFCCGDSAACETISRICKNNNIPIFCACEFCEFSKFNNVIFTGTMPNQQIIPALKWCSENLGKRYLLIGSDTSTSKFYNLIVRESVNTAGGELIAEICIPAEGGDFDSAMKKIAESKPDVILNTMSGDSNIFFFINLWAKKIRPEKVPVISFVITEKDFKNLSFNEVSGAYIVKSYFPNIESEANRKFVKKLKEKCGESLLIEDSVDAGYFGVYLWKQAVEDAETDNAKEVSLFLTAQNFDAPEGMVCIDVGNRYTWKTMRIGKVGKNKTIDIVWSSEQLINPRLDLENMENSGKSQNNSKRIMKMTGGSP